MCHSTQEQVQAAVVGFGNGMPSDSVVQKIADALSGVVLERNTDWFWFRWFGLTIQVFVDIK
jgi:phosphoglucomutase